MLRVEMPMDSWVDLLYMLSILDSHHVASAEVDAMFKNISEQIYSRSNIQGGSQ
jgi:hypothetical protein